MTSSHFQSKTADNEWNKRSKRRYRQPITAMVYLLPLSFNSIKQSLMR
ncbi:hypothetical protein L910_0486 [Vibrio fluvialis PG41]|uniref:Uncharacterized protein n=1 Tax=Vibrio fluvialis PG41 TaxID=1336752 RepID=S7JSX2_VIBFL|nr:hypothetical protein L910_0486 [Vibrio fluvialis PG41]